MTTINYKERLKNPMRTIRHGLEEISIQCRVCGYSDTSEKDISKKAREHAKKTGHTVDIYRENWTEITFYKKDLEGDTK